MKRSLEFCDLWLAGCGVMLALVLAFVVGLLVASSAWARSDSVTFGYTGTAQTWTVPAGVTSARFTVVGAGGGHGTGEAPGGRGGAGAVVSAWIEGLTAGREVSVTVGGAGGDPVAGFGGAAGFNGGAAGGVDADAAGGGGGGASKVELGSTLELMAGGGGGGGAGAWQFLDSGVQYGGQGGDAGDWGYDGGSFAWGIPPFWDFYVSGGGGGGSGGSGEWGGYPGLAGRVETGDCLDYDVVGLDGGRGGSGAGGAGANSADDGLGYGGAGGGGGGGYWGGGGGGSGSPGLCWHLGNVPSGGGGGGGGSSYANTASGSGVSQVTFATAAQPGNGQVTIEWNVGPAASVAVSLSPSSIVANGTATTTATARATDASGVGVPGENVSFSASDPGVQIGLVVDHGHGTYTAKITSSKVAGRVTVTATDSSVSPSVSGRLTLIQAPGPATSVTLAVSPASIIANGISQSTATVKVTDAKGNPVSRDSVKLSSSDSGEAIGLVTAHGKGIYTAKIISSTVAHQVTITATDSTTHISGQAKLTQTPGRAKRVTVGLSPSSIPASGASTSIATATVTDAYGNRLAGQSVSFSSSDPGVRIGAVTRHSNGTYTATLRSSRIVHLVTVTATDSSVSPVISGQATLTQTAPPTFAG